MISVVILTKNEENNIKECIESVKWCDEIVVIDDNSTDKSVDIAKKLGAKVYSHTLNNNFSAQRNFGLSKASHEWVLFVDADERVSIALWYEIMQRTNETFGDHTGYYIKRKDVMWGRVLKYGETGNSKFLRLARRDAGEWVGLVHETWKVKGNTGTLNNSLDHFPHTSIEEFLKEINYYTDLRSHELFEKKTKVHIWQIIMYPNSKFVLNYFFRVGFLDGLPGFVLAMNMSLHSFLVRAKLWLLWNKQKNV